MASTGKKVVVVFGATGIQGGSVVKALLNDPVASQQFHVRAITRDPSKPAALALAKDGAEVAQADLEDKDSLRKVLKGAYATYVVTNFEVTMSPAAETRQGKNAADVAKELDIKHLIWSALPSPSKISNEKYTLVAHFESKALVTSHILSLSIPHTIVQVGAYTSLVFDSIEPLPTTPPSYGLIFPTPVHSGTKLPILDAAADVGKFVRGILLHPELSLNKTFNLATQVSTLGEIVDILKKAGLNISLHILDVETFKAALEKKGVPEWFQEDLLQVYQFTEEFGLYGGFDSIEEAKKLLLTEPLVSIEDSFKRNSGFSKLL